MKKINSIYPSLLSAIFQSNNIVGEASENNYLQSLQPFVSQLRNSYRNSNVTVDYGDRRVQEAYLLAYYPSYIQQSYDTLISHQIHERLTIDSESIEISMFGCGPCPELAAISGFISEYFPNVKKITANIFDIAVDTWAYSISLAKYITPQIWDGQITVRLHPSIDLRTKNDLGNIQCLSDSTIITFQNCINEITTENTNTQDVFIENLESIICGVKTLGVVLLSDLSGYSSVRSIFTKLSSLTNRDEHQIMVNQLDSLLKLYVIIPPQIKNHLLTGESNLIPRKKIEYSSTAIAIMAKDNISTDIEYINFVRTLLGCEQGKERAILQSRPDLFNEKLLETMLILAERFKPDPQRSSDVTLLFRLFDQILAESYDTSAHIRFVHDLVNCSESQQENLINQNQKLVNKDFFILAQKVSDTMLRRGDEQGHWLLHISRHLIHCHIVVTTIYFGIKNPFDNMSLVVKDYTDIVRFDYLNQAISSVATAFQNQSERSPENLILPRMMNMMHRTLLDLEVEATSDKMSVYRPNQPFSKMEQSLGLWAFANWLFLGEQVSQDGERYQDYLMRDNDTARFAALSFVDKKLDGFDDSGLIEHIHKEFPKFDSVQEIEWGFQKADHTEWEVSLTRAIILLCRGLAYRYTGNLGFKSQYLNSLKSSDIRTTAVAMFDCAVGKVAQESKQNKVTEVNALESDKIPF